MSAVMTEWAMSEDHHLIEFRRVAVAEGSATVVRKKAGIYRHMDVPWRISEDEVKADAVDMSMS